MRKRLGENVRRFRKRLGLSQAQLAEQNDVTETTVARIERGETWMTYDNIQSFARTLKVPEEALFEGTPAVIKPTPREALEVLDALVNANDLVRTLPALPPETDEVLSLVAKLNANQLGPLATFIKNALMVSAAKRGKDTG